MTLVAIDGPAGAGKSTVARAVADRLGFAYLDTGAMYRAVALAAIERGVDPMDPDAVAAVARRTTLTWDGDAVLLEGRAVGDRIRAADVTAVVSAVAAVPAVRAVLVAAQRAFAAGRDAVVEGRDIGTVVFPDADVKVFLTASPAERALRRARQEESLHADIAAIEADIARRDEADAGRATSPFARASDAVVVESTGRPVGDVVTEIVALVGDKARDAG